MVLAKAWSDSDKLLIPVVVGGNETPPFLRDWVSLQIDPNAEPARWTAEVLKVLRSSRNRAVHGNGSREQQERHQRFDEMAHATEELQKRESGDLPADS
jgi:hypothetical protein